MERMFAKPFVRALEGHSDGVYSLAASPTSLVALLSGAGDGEVRIWDIAHGKTVWSVFAHDGIVKGLSAFHDGTSFVSVGVDKTIKQYALSLDEALGISEVSASSSEASAVVEPLNAWTVKYPLTGCDCRWSDEHFVTSGGSFVELWNPNRASPLQRLSWGADTVTCVRASPSERHVLASAGNDNAITLYDTRSGNPLRKVVLKMGTNSIDWNPREPMNFVAANEDHNLYTFDMRKLDRALMVHTGFVGAVMSVRFSPTGREFVAGSYDRTVRMFSSRAGGSRDVYHTKRMQRVFAVHYSGDAKYVLSGSDDTNVRVWRARASDQGGKLKERERAAKEYRESLTKRYGHMPEVRKILKHRHTPSSIKRATKRDRDAAENEARKLDNRVKNSKAGSVERESFRAKRIAREQV
jgi:DDB1- and CUL4-associated factor 13